MTQPTLFITGAGPGTGKSTIAGHIHTAFERRSIPTHCWYETDVLQQAQFLPFLERFRLGDPDMGEALKVALESYLIECVPASAAFIAESLIPFVRWLLLGEVPSEKIMAFCDWLSCHVEDREPVFVVLSCPKQAAIDRARRERGEKWYEQNKKRTRNYPLYRTHPELDRWYVFEQEREYFKAFDWPHLDFDTSMELESDIVEAILARFDLPPEGEAIPTSFRDGTYRAMGTKTPFAKITISGGSRIQMGGIWLDLIGRADGSARIDRTNSLIRPSAVGLELNSLRLGQVIYQCVQDD